MRDFFFKTVLSDRKHGRVNTPFFRRMAAAFRGRRAAFLPGAAGGWPEGGGANVLLQDVRRHDDHALVPAGPLIGQNHQCAG